MVVWLLNISKDRNPKKAKHIVCVFSKCYNGQLYQTKKEGHGSREAAINECVTALKERVKKGHVATVKMEEIKKENEKRRKEGPRKPDAWTRRGSDRR